MSRTVSHRSTNRDSVAIVKRLSTAIHHEFAVLGEEVSVSSQAVPHTRLRRVTVKSPLFHRLGHFEQIDYIWRIAGRTLDADDLAFISIIYTVDPLEDTFETPKRPARRVRKATPKRKR